jgi:hypothetical protein
MTYFERLHPWCIVRNLPNNNYTVVARFRHRDDAVAYLQVLRQSHQNIAFAIIFQRQTAENILINQALN